MDASESLPPYQYQPLGESSDSIRLLLLEPAACEDENLRGRLVTRSLSSFEDDLNSHYAALSYVWGNPLRTRSIEIAYGGEHFRHGLTTSLYEALKNIREEQRAILIWADAICIDQDNNSERGHQVNLMGKIYRNAGCTVIYLGHLNSAIKCLFECITHQSVAELKRAAEDLCSREWFSRGWVFQELVLSRNPRVQCDRYRVGWEQLYSAIQSYLPTPSPGDLLQTMDTARNDRKSRTFSQLVIARKGTLVSDPRDYFFCLLGIASDADAVQRFLPTDYSQGVRDVFIRAARYMVNDLGLSAVQAHVGSDTSRYDLPSFVPTWGISSLEALSHASAGRLISLPSEIDVLSQSLIRPMEDRRIFTITILSAITPSETAFFQSFNENVLSFTKDKKYGAASLHILLQNMFNMKRQGLLCQNFWRAVRDKCQAIEVFDSGKPEALVRPFNIEGSMEPEILDLFPFILEKTVKDLCYVDDWIANDETPRHRWAFCDGRIAFVPPDTICGDLIVRLGEDGDTMEEWFVLRPAGESHFHTENSVIPTHFRSENQPSLLWLKKKDLKSYKDWDTPIEGSIRYGEVKGPVIVLDLVKDVWPRSRPPSHIGLI